MTNAIVRVIQRFFKSQIAGHGVAEKSLPILVRHGGEQQVFGRGAFDRHEGSIFALAGGSGANSILRVRHELCSPANGPHGSAL